MKEIDQKLELKVIQIFRRPFDAFFKLSPNSENIPLINDPNRIKLIKKHQGQYEGINLFEKICDWYTKIYGDKSELNFEIGKTPILINDRIYFILIPNVNLFPNFRNTKITIFIKELTDDLDKILNQNEKIELENIFEFSKIFYSFFNKIYDPPYTQIYAKELLKSGISDINSSVSTLKNNPPSTNISCYHSQQFIEKLLKSFLVEKKGLNEKCIKYKYSHNLEIILEQLINDQNEYKSIIESEDFNNINYPVSIRYKTNLSLKDAVETNHSAMKLTLDLIEKCSMERYFFLCVLVL